MTAGRSAPITVVGPPGAERFHDIRTLFARLFSEKGAFPDLQGLLSANEFPIEIRIAQGAGETIYNNGDLRVRASRVPHGSAPALGFRIDTDEFSIVFAGDQTARDPDFAAFARSADLLVLHTIVNDSLEGRPLANVVALPRDLGRLAASANVKRVLFSHFMKAPADTANAEVWSLADLSSVLAAIRKEYDGPVETATDLFCMAL